MAAFHDRLARYAAFLVVHAFVTVLTVAGVLSPVVLFVASLPVFFAWGAFQGDLAVNSPLDPVDRQRWSIGFWCFPWLMSVYWWEYVRGRDLD